MKLKGEAFVRSNSRYLYLVAPILIYASDKKAEMNYIKSVFTATWKNAL